MGKRFSRQKENFVCENCGKEVIGDGYTNHCPHCLYSKHVDINPGDRQRSCRGLMKPVKIEIKSGKYIIVHQCLECGVVKKNKTSPNDSFGAILTVARKGQKGEWDD